MTLLTVSAACLAINFPTSMFKHYDSYYIDIEIWGDNMFNFKGTIKKNDGEFQEGVEVAARAEPREHNKNKRGGEDSE